MDTQDRSSPTRVGKRIHQHLYVQVVVAVVLGILLGSFYPTLGASLKPLGDVFIRAIKMVVPLLIFTTIVVGIAGAEDMKKVGRVGGLALVYFEIVSTLALVVGLLVVNVLTPGAGMNIDPSALDASAVAEYTTGGKSHGLSELLSSVVPSSAVGAFAEGEILQILLFSVLFGLALHKCGGRSSRVFGLIEELSHALFGIVGMVMRVAPLAAFGAMAFTVGRFGLGSMLSLAKLMATFYFACFVFVFGVLGVIARSHGFSLWKLLRYLREELLVVLGTSSSEAVLPRMLSKLESLGASKPVVAVVVPTGYSFNLDGTSIYLTMAAIFIAQATNTPMTITQQLTLLAVLLLSSKGAAAITGGGFIVLAATLSAVGGIPVAGLALILGIDRFMSEARAITNLIGNAVGTLVIAKWTGSLDVATLDRELATTGAKALSAAVAVTGTEATIGS